MNKGFFITIEGGEGVGKSTFAAKLKNELEHNGYQVVLTREPGGKGLAIAEDIRKIIMDHGDVNTRTELLLFGASRSEHIGKVIKPALEQGKIVICDRYEDSTRVYQGIVGGVEKDVIDAVNNVSAYALGHPDVTLILDLDPKVAMERIAQNMRDTNRFDMKSLDYHKNIRQAFLDIAKEDERYKVYDATLIDVDEIVCELIKKIESKL